MRTYACPVCLADHQGWIQMSVCWAAHMIDMPIAEYVEVLEAATVHFDEHGDHWDVNHWPTWIPVDAYHARKAEIQAYLWGRAGHGPEMPAKFGRSLEGRDTPMAVDAADAAEACAMERWKKGADPDQTSSPA